MSALMLTSMLASGLCTTTDDPNAYACQGEVNVVRCKSLDCLFMGMEADAYGGADDTSKLPPSNNIGTPIQMLRGQSGLIYVLPPIDKKSEYKATHLVCYGKRSQRHKCEAALRDVESRHGLTMMRRAPKKLKAKKQPKKKFRWFWEKDTSRRKPRCKKTNYGRICPRYTWEKAAHKDLVAAMADVGRRASRVKEGESALGKCSYLQREVECTVFTGGKESVAIGIIEDEYGIRTFECRWRGNTFAPCGEIAIRSILSSEIPSAGVDETEARIVE